MKYASIQAMNMAICEALGLDPMTVSAIDISLRLHELPSVVVTFPGVLDDALGSTLSRYRLVPDDDDERAA